MKTDSQTVPRWDAKQYRIFAVQRLRPALDLLERVPVRSPSLIVDLGCGTGEVTRLLADRWPQARVEGIDSSADMIEKASSQRSRVCWKTLDVGNWHPGQSADLIYSNSALHWLDDHASLFPRLLDSLAGGGCLAVQMPLSRDLPSHRLMRETLATGAPGGGSFGAAELLERVSRKRILEPAEYYELLSGRARSIDIWITEYVHVLSGEDAVLEWVLGAGLRPVLGGLCDGHRDAFLAEYSHRLRGSYPKRADGKTLYQLPRIFIVLTV